MRSISKPRRFRWAGGLLAATVALAGTPARAQEPDPCHDPEHADHGSYECKVARLRERNFVVIAFVDTGINPYHMDFRLPAGDDMQDVPPWEYIEGYPSTARTQNLSFNATTYDAAVARDRWSSVMKDALYWFPGTKIVGGYSSSTDTRWGGPILDAVSGHGTGTASLGAGRIHGFSPDAEALIVAVQGLGPAPFRWAVEQPWIDIVSNSWGYLANLYFATDEHRASRVATQAGKVVPFAAGNGASNTAVGCDRVVTTSSPTAGPPWNLVVGAVSARNGQSYCWNSIPPDVSSYAIWPAARFRSYDEENPTFGPGTSIATPITAGVVASQVLAARRALGDTTEGPHGNAALAVAEPGATLPTSGPLADGVLVRQEVEETTMKTAYPEAFDVDRCRNDVVDCVRTWPTTPVSFTYVGYGVVNSASQGRAMDVLFGRQTMPDRTVEDAWMLAKDTASGAVWGTI